MSEAIIEKVRQFAESHFAGDGSGHDWWHVHRVWNMAKHLADAEGSDRTIVEIAEERHRFMESYLDHFFKEWNDEL